MPGGLVGPYGGLDEEGNGGGGKSWELGGRLGEGNVEGNNEPTLRQEKAEPLILPLDPTNLDTTLRSPQLDLPPSSTTSSRSPGPFSFLGPSATRPVERSELADSFPSSLSSCRLAEQINGSPSPSRLAGLYPLHLHPSPRLRRSILHDLMLLSWTSRSQAHEPTSSQPNYPSSPLPPLRKHRLRHLSALGPMLYSTRALEIRRGCWRASKAR